jgi:hypothetical protein
MKLKIFDPSNTLSTYTTSDYNIINIETAIQMFDYDKIFIFYRK